MNISVIHDFTSFHDNIKIGQECNEPLHLNIHSEYFSYPWLYMSPWQHMNGTRIYWTITKLILPQYYSTNVMIESSRLHLKFISVVWLGHNQSMYWYHKATSSMYNYSWNMQECLTSLKLQRLTMQRHKLLESYNLWLFFLIC